MSTFPITHRNEIKRVSKRANYKKSTIYKIIDEALYCHVGFTQEKQPFVIPTMHARMEDKIILHGSKTSRLIKHIEAGNEVCIAITLLDGLVLARSAFHHSMNYRSVVIFGRGNSIETDDEKRLALQALMEHMLPGRWADVRKPNQEELNSTGVVSIPIDDASAKIRTGPPVDDPEDDDLLVWTGLLPFHQRAEDPVNDPRIGKNVPIPEYIIHSHR
ncbi:MAG: flavin-nucleotide-binding protein [Chloroflexi bacterium RBG_16_48_8]|nr:MAG: flavin-nucleotide-binding protein [Chloroflexi bacterium RBG_16_48_8]